MSLWIPITFVAAFLQNLRTSLQALLRGRVGPSGATFVRFVYAVPFAALLAVAALMWEPQPPSPNLPWFAWAVTGGVAQILGTAALLAAVPKAGFAVASGYSKTEPILAAVVGALILFEAPTPLAALAILIGVGGVWMATVQPRATNAEPGKRLNLSDALSAGLTLGVASAALFALASVGYRAASLSLESGAVVTRAAMTLVGATSAQTVIMGVWMAFKAPDELRAVAKAWRPGLMVGAAGGFASFGWFAAFTMEPAAHVRALAQIELIFAAITAAIWFGEKQSKRKLLGMGLIGASAALLLAAV